MKAILKKLAAAKATIKKTTHKKMGRNTFPNYDYFLPEQIEQMVHDVCAEFGLLSMFALVRNELGIEGVLKICDVETGESIDLKMATAIPEIKATNTAQQLGGCMTYTERYLKMSAFGIVENGLDYDSHDNTRKEPSKTTTQAADKGSPEKWLNVKDKSGNITPEWKNIIDGIFDLKISSVNDVRKFYKVSKEVAGEIEKALAE